MSTRPSYREVVKGEKRRIMQGLYADDPSAEERRYARLGLQEIDREALRGIRGAFAALGRSCGFNRLARCTPKYRVEGGKIVRDTEDITTKSVGEPAASSSATAGSGSEDELCSAFGSARF